MRKFFALFFRHSYKIACLGHRSGVLITGYRFQRMISVHSAAWVIRAATVFIGFLPRTNAFGFGVASAFCYPRTDLAQF